MRIEPKNITFSTLPTRQWYLQYIHTYIHVTLKNIFSHILFIFYNVSTILIHSLVWTSYNIVHFGRHTKKVIYQKTYIPTPRHGICGRHKNCTWNGDNVRHSFIFSGTILNAICLTCVFDLFRDMAGLNLNFSLYFSAGFLYKMYILFLYNNRLLLSKVYMGGSSHFTM